MSYNSPVPLQYHKLRTPSMVSGCRGESLSLESKKVRLLEPHIAQNRLATIVLVRIATSIEELASPNTATGCSRGRPDSLSLQSAIGTNLGKKGKSALTGAEASPLPRLEKYLRHYK